MSISSKIFEIILSVKLAFVQERTFKKFTWLLYALFGVCGRHTISSFILFLRFEQQDWTSIYRLFSKDLWDPEQATKIVLKKALSHVISKKDNTIMIAIDDFRIAKTGKSIPHTAFQRDPMSPAFHPNLVWGQRYLHMTLLFARKKRGRWTACRSIPISIKLTPHINKLSKNASDKDISNYRKEKELHKLTSYAVKFIKELRAVCDEFGYESNKILIVADGSYCNKTVIQGLPERVELIARCRKDAKLYKRSKDKNRFYDNKSVSVKPAAY